MADTSPAGAPKGASASMTDRLRTTPLAAYAALTFPMGGLGLPITVYLPPLYATDVGLGLSLVGFLFMITRIFDVITDPIMGVIIDHYPTRWGRRRHWIALSVPILLISAIFIYFPPVGAGGAYLLTWMLVLYVGYTMLTIAHQSWGAELSADYAERNRIYGWREVAIILGMVSVLGLPAVLEITAGADAFGKVGAMGWFLIITLPITAIAAVLLVPDHVTKMKTGQSLELKEGLRILFTNWSMGRIVAADMFTALATGIIGSSYLFLARFVWELPQYSSIMLLGYFVLGFAGMPFWMWLAKRMSKHRALCVALIWSIVAQLIYLIPGPGDFALALFATFFLGFAFGAGPFLLRSMMADVCDKDRLETGQNRTALLYAMLTTTAKVGAAISVGMTYPLLAWVGFDPATGSENSAQALDGLRLIFALLPILFLAAAIALIWNYPIDHAAQAEIRRKLAEMHAADKALAED
ncbi:MFS transporter [Pyruvatibacter mobilis]|uniref:MFS transporter n=1 Tax=Pyruvatibacter mobilis TaxID=1712261 RepID=UPI003BA87A83